MTTQTAAIDCDIHPTVPGVRALAPYLDDFWRDSVEARGITSLDSISYPPGAPLTARPDWRGKNGLAAADVSEVQRHVFDGLGASTAILNCIYGVHLVLAEDMAAAFARAVNDWLAKEWLDRDPRLRASIVVPLQNIEYAVDEIERCAKDQRFVQILVPVMGEVPLGRRSLWPIYAAAERHSFSADAVGPAVVCRFSRTSFARFVEHRPNVLRRINEFATGELDQARDQMVLLGRRSAEGKVATFLIGWRDRLARLGQVNGAVPLPMGRQDIADYLGLTVETVSRTLTKFERDGVIEILPGAIRLKNPARAEAIAAA